MSSKYTYELCHNNYLIRLTVFIDRACNSVEGGSNVCTLTKVVERTNLVYEQKMAHNIITRNCLDDVHSGDCVIIWGMGGCGKSKTIYAIQTTLSHAGVMLFTTSTTGLTVNHTGGMITHSLLH